MTALDLIWAAAETGEFEALGSGTLFVAVVLAAGSELLATGEDWSCCLSIKAIQRRSQMGRSTIERHLATLATEGWISREPQLLGNGGRAPSRCFIHGDVALRAALARARRPGGQRSTSGTLTDLNLIQSEGRRIELISSELGGPPVCDVAVHLPSVGTGTRARREYRARQGSRPVHSCGLRALYLVDGHPQCPAHAGRSALASLGITHA